MLIRLIFDAWHNYLKQYIVTPASNKVWSSDDPHTYIRHILTGRNLRNNTEHSFPLPKINHPVLTTDSEVHSNVKWLCLRCIYNKANVCILWWGLPTCPVPVLHGNSTTCRLYVCWFVRMRSVSKFTHICNKEVDYQFYVFCYIHLFTAGIIFMSECLIFLFCSWLCWIKCIVN